MVTYIKKNTHLIHRVKTLLALLIMSFISTNLSAQILSSYCDGNPADWANFRTTYAINGYKLDPANAVNNTDDQFTQGSKDEMLLSDWHWSLGSANAKGDITNAAVALTGTNLCILRFAADRTSNNGDASIGFWLFRSTVSTNSDGTFSGAHTNGDILILSDFTGGGTTPTITIYEWLNGSLVLQSASTARCADVNHVTRSVPAGFTYTAANGATNYAPNLFYEGAIDLCALNISNCFASFLVETRNSQSITASLQDFAMGSFNATPGTPSATVVQPTCTTATGTVNVTSPVTGYTYKLTGPSPSTSFVTSTTGVFQNVAPGTYSLTAAQGTCVSGARPVVVNAQPQTPPRPVVTLQEATICGTRAAPTVTVSCPIIGTYKLTQTGQTDQTFAYNGSNGPVVFTIKPGLGGFSITVTNADNCTSAATNCTNYASNTCPSSTVTKAEVQPVELTAPKTSVLAAPNPFTNRVRFKIQSAVSGMGSLELYNTLGQKVATVYQGYVEAGKPLDKEYSVNRASHSNLIYVFRVGDQKTSGKLLNW